MRIKRNEFNIGRFIFDLQTFAIGVILIFLISLGIALAQDIPPPFDEIKKMAMDVKADEDGDYMVKLDLREDGDYNFMLCYYPSQKIILIYKAEYGSICYHEDETAFTTPSMWGHLLLVRKIAIEEANKILDEIKNLNCKST